MTTSQQSEMKAAFELFDIHGSGKVGAKELQTCLLGLGIEVTNPILFGVLSELEQFSREGKSVTLDDFIQLMAPANPSKGSIEDIHRIFRLIDVDGSGFISVGKLQAACDEIGEPLSQEELHEMIIRADADGDGLVSFDEFYTIMTQKMKD